MSLSSGSSSGGSDSDDGDASSSSRGSSIDSVSSGESRSGRSPSPKATKEVSVVGGDSSSAAQGVFLVEGEAPVVGGPAPEQEEQHVQVDVVPAAAAITGLLGEGGKAGGASSAEGGRKGGDVAEMKGAKVDGEDSLLSSRRSPADCRRKGTAPRTSERAEICRPFGGGRGKRDFRPANRTNQLRLRSRRSVDRNPAGRHRVRHDPIAPPHHRMRHDPMRTRDHLHSPRHSDRTRDRPVKKSGNGGGKALKTVAKDDEFPLLLCPE